MTTCLPVDAIVKQSSQAIKALQSYRNKNHDKKSEINEVATPDTLLLLTVTLDKIPKKVSVKPHRLRIPFPWRDPADPKLSVCLITKDPLEEKVKGVHSIPCLQYIDSVKGLGNKHKSFEARRLLCASHDLFLADDRILPLLPKILGKVFFDKKKLPVPVDLTGKLPERLKAAISATYLHLSSGPCITIKIGLMEQPIEELQKNINAVLEQLAGKLLEGGHDNIRRLSLRTGDSVSLPIFESAA